MFCEYVTQFKYVGVTKTKEIIMKVRENKIKSFFANI